MREYWLADPKARFLTIYSLSANGADYVILGQFGTGEVAHSNVLEGLEMPVKALFLPEQSH